MNPSEDLERSFGAWILLRRLPFLGRLRSAREGQPVLDRPELASTGIAIFDRKSDEIGGRLPILPVHRQQHHTFAAIDFEREESRSGGPRDKGRARHVESDLSIRPDHYSRLLLLRPPPRPVENGPPRAWHLPKPRPIAFGTCPTCSRLPLLRLPTATTLPRSRSSRVSSRSAVAPACTSAAPTPAPSTTSPPRSSTIAWTRRLRASRRASRSSSTRAIA